MVAKAFLVFDICGDTTGRNWWQYYCYVDRSW